MANAVRPMIYVSFLEFQAGSCLYVTAAVRGGSLRASRTWSQRTKVCSRLIGVCWTLRCTYIVHTSTRQVFLGCCNEVWFHRFPSPPFGSPFTFSPSHTLLFLFLFMSSLASCPFISLLSFFCAYNGPGLSVYAHIYFQLRC